MEFLELNNEDMAELIYLDSISESLVIYDVIYRFINRRFHKHDGDFVVGGRPCAVIIDSWSTIIVEFG